MVRTSSVLAISHDTLGHFLWRKRSLQHKCRGDKIVQGALPAKLVYTRDELQEFSEEAGLPRVDAELHTEGNFLNIPTGKIDLFDMEGNPNEHQTSTGIADCPSPYPPQTGNLNACRVFDPIVGNVKCTPTPPCQTPERAQRAFNIYLGAADISPKDGLLTPAES